MTPAEQRLSDILDGVVNALEAANAFRGASELMAANDSDDPALRFGSEVLACVAEMLRERARVTRPSLTVVRTQSGA